MVLGTNYKAIFLSFHRAKEAHQIFRIATRVRSIIIHSHRLPKESSLNLFIMTIPPLKPFTVKSHFIPEIFSLLSLQGTIPLLSWYMYLLVLFSFVETHLLRCKMLLFYHYVECFFDLRSYNPFESVWFWMCFFKFRS